jgi:predicted dehydrogenase
MGDTINIAVIGYGGMGGWHAQMLDAMDDEFNLVGIYDIDPERGRVAEDRDIKAFASLEELLADESIELVTIAAYNDVHKELAIKAMEAGKNVICEKPVTLCSADLEEMIAASERTGKLFTVHQNRRWDNDYLTAKKIVDDNTLGRVFRIESKTQGSRGIPGDWRSTKVHGGGMVLDWGVHLLDQILTMNDDNPLVSVYASLTNITNDEVDDGCYINMRFENGLEVLVEVTTNNFYSLPRWYILGENGTAVIEDWDLNGKIVMVEDWENRDAVPVLAGQGLTKTMAPRTDDSIKEFPLDKQYGMWGEYYENIHNVLNGKATQIVTHRQIRRSLKLMEAVFESAEKNEVIKLNI